MLALGEIETSILGQYSPNSHKAAFSKRPLLTQSKRAYFLNVKFETLTFSAACFERGVSAPSILGRSSYISAAALSAAPKTSAPISAAILRFWLWMQMQFGVLRPRPARKVCSTPSHTFHLPTSEPGASQKSVRVNRAMMRRLKRLIRLRGASYFEGPSVGAGCARLGLTLRQYRDYMIRCRGYSRVRLFSLGLGRRAMMLRSIFCVSLRGDAASLRRAGVCGARLSPD